MRVLRPCPPVFALPGRLPLATITTAVLLAGCAGAPRVETTGASAEDGFPVEVSACGHTSTVESVPERAVTLNQGATEVMLALGLEDRMAGTAYLDDQVAEEHRAAYESVEVLAEQYPSREVLLDARPDFVYASYASAFGDDVAGSQEELAASGVASYLSPFGCERAADGVEPSFANVWSEIDAVATAFGVPDRAEALREEQEQALAEVAEESPGDGLDVVWYDSGQKVPLVGAGDGGPAVIMDAVGATNVFSDVDGGWGEVSWERVVDADPDVIVLADASWSSAADKRRHLENDPVLSELSAVEDGAVVTLPYSATTPGVRMAEGALTVADQLRDLN